MSAALLDWLISRMARPVADVATMMQLLDAAWYAREPVLVGHGKAKATAAADLPRDLADDV